MLLGYLWGSFDLFNVGDLDVIAQACALSDRLVVGVLTDESVERLLGRPPVVPFAERAAILSHVRGVDQVVLHDSGAPEWSAADVVFSAGEPVVGSAPESVEGSGSGRPTVILSPARATSSTGVRDALRFLPRSSVA